MASKTFNKSFERAMAAAKKGKGNGLRFVHGMSDLDVDEALDAYLTAAIWSTSGTTPDGRELENLDDEYSVDDFSDEAVKQARSTIAKFFAANAKDLRATGADASQHGHDLWLTRERHGVGFWDRGYGPAGDRLTATAHKLGEADIYVGDDNKLYFAR